MPLRVCPEVRGSKLHVLFLDWDFNELYERVEAAIDSHAKNLAGHGGWGGW